MTQVCIQYFNYQEEHESVFENIKSDLVIPCCFCDLYIISNHIFGVIVVKKLYVVLILEYLSYEEGLVDSTKVNLIHKR